MSGVRKTSVDLAHQFQMPEALAICIMRNASCGTFACIGTACGYAIVKAEQFLRTIKLL